MPLSDALQRLVSSQTNAKMGGLAVGGGLDSPKGAARRVAESRSVCE